MTRTVVVQGASRGLGLAFARSLKDRGDHVIGTARDPASAELRSLGIPVVPLDVTDAASVVAAADRLAAEVDGLDGVVNFAGILAVGSMIEIPEQALARVIDVNVMGTFRVNRALFPLLAARKGRIINVSSETGWQSGMPFNGAYAMTKHAIEAYSDSLRRELMFLDVPVIKIQPGPFKTEMVAGIERAFARAAEESTYFCDLLTKLKDLTVREQEKAHDPAIIAETIHTALTATSPSSAYSVKPDLQRAAMNVLPDWVTDPLLKLVLRP